MDSSHPSGLPGVAIDRLAESLAGLVTVMVAGGGALIEDLTVAEPAHDLLGQPGDLVLGIATQGVAESLALIDDAGQRGAVGVMLRRSVAETDPVRDAARQAQVALLALSEQASWAHTVWLLRSMLDRVQGRSGVDGTDAVGDDLFALADGCASLLDAPVTIEDPFSRVLAYSSRQGVVDPVRVETLVGRRVPEEALASLRSRGVLRRLATESEPFYVPADGTLRGRLVIPVRAGTLRLGSIWAVVDQPPPADRLAALTQTASVVALHLLRIRSEADLAVRATADRLRDVLTGVSELRDSDDWLGVGPWRAVVLDVPRGVLDVPMGVLGVSEQVSAEGRRADGKGGRGESDGVPVSVWGLWESALRRAAWRRPLLTTMGEHLVAVVGGGPAAESGSWAWLQALATRLGEDHPVRIAGGSQVDHAGDLTRSVREAIQLARVQSGAPEVGSSEVGSSEVGAITDVDRAWADLVLARAVDGIAEVAGLGPIAGLLSGPVEDRSTVAAWLDHPGDPRAAAARLHIHPNTLRYRMARIRAALTIDLDEARTRDAVRLQLRSAGV